MRYPAVFIAVVVMLSLGSAKDDFQAADFVKQHLNSIGTEQARTAVTNQLAEGEANFQILHSTVNVDGKMQFVSEADKFNSVLRLPSADYRGEQFVSDGKKNFVSQNQPGIYSHLGQFVHVHNEILTEGLWGGTLSTGWALAHWEERRAKLQDRGLKNVDGGDLHRVDYVPKKESDLHIELYFEPETLRHVMTIYSLTVNPTMSRSISRSAQQQDRRLQLEEQFADFKSVDNLTLPGRWTIRFSSEGSGGGAVGPGAAGSESRTEVNQFEVTVTRISHNISLNPKNFEVK